ncbi:MAG: hypothetical protein EA370_12585 [Wenzhouxiangella sp.]|nr:MAG: hypothetical protein EA370_12585 [Wenzhouxiangella sp.]
MNEKELRMKIITWVATVIFTAIVLAGPVMAQPISYQGYLEQQGQPFSDTVDLEFRLFNVPEVGGQIGPTLFRPDWSVTDGLFQVELDFGSRAFSSDFGIFSRYLEIRVDGTLLSPRQRVTHAPWALYALDVEPTSLDGRFWRRWGNAGTSPEDFIGTTDEQPFVIRVANRSALRIQPSNINYGPSIIAGHRANSVASGVDGATISGGGESAGPNHVTDSLGAIGGGSRNHAHSWAVVAGGRRNTASGRASFVGGGERNCAGGRYSWAGGHRAKVRPGTESGGEGIGCGGVAVVGALGDLGSFVWADSTNADFISERANQFRVRANGGADFQTGAYGLKSFSDSSGTSAAAVQAESLHPAGIALVGRNDSTDATMVLNNRGSGRLIRAFSHGAELMRLENNGNLWIAGTLSQGSDRANKQDLESVDVQAVLDQLADLEISSWRYLRGDPESRHIGPMAQDFHAAFGYGVSDDSISSIDAQGIAFAAIQALNERLHDARLSLGQQLGALEEENVALRAEVAVLKAQSSQMRELADRNAELEARLAALEGLLLDNRAVAKGW